MQEIELQQGSPEWHAHRRTHYNASDAAAMLGIDPNKSRSDLLREYAAGVTKEIDAATQRRFDDGHRFEALARPLAEKIVGEDLYPRVGVLEGTKYSASFDGLTMLEDVAFEHKTINNDLRYTGWDEDNGYHLPEKHQVQMEQQCMVSKAGRVLFMASKWEKAPGYDEEPGRVYGMAHDENGNLCRYILVEERHCWYASDPAMRARIAAGWAQFERDLAGYIPPEVKPALVADAVQALPAVSVQVSGSLAVAENFGAFEAALRQFLAERLIREPKTDQDFATLDEQIKALKRAEDALDAAEAQMLAQVASVDAAKRAKDALHKLTRDNRLMAEKLLAAEKERRRAEKVREAREAFAAHVVELQREIHSLRLDVPAPDFAGAIRSLKTLTSIQDKLDTALANGKVAADQQATDLRTKLAWIDANAAEHRALLADLQQLAVKPFDDFKLAVTARIDAHKKAEAERLEAERERIRQEEERKAKEVAERATEAERQRIRAEEQHKAQMEAAEKVKAEQAMVAVEVASPTPLHGQCGTVAYTSDGQQSATAEHSSAVETMNLGQINAALGFTVSADFLASLGILPIRHERAAKLYDAGKFATICQLIQAHLSRVMQKGFKLAA